MICEFFVNFSEISKLFVLAYYEEYSYDICTLDTFVHIVSEAVFQICSIKKVFLLKMYEICRNVGSMWGKFYQTKITKFLISLIFLIAKYCSNTKTQHMPLHVSACP